ncbi:hypothetical protein, partial [Rhizobium leguminosarum]|uniref:hypothetical protein n=1 Tax=Rhizobium leguminosarum TaxID=384 RepID=UPI001C98BB20
MRRLFYGMDRYDKHEKRNVIRCFDGEFDWEISSLSVILGLEPLLSGLNLVDKVHGVDSTRIRAFGDDLGHERGTTPCGTRIAS